MADSAADRLARKWERASPKTRKEVEEFYRATEDYIEDLREWNGTPMWKDEAETVFGWLGKHGCKSVLDFGGGIGTFARLARERGFRCDYYDISEKSIEYARKENKVELARDISGHYDAVVLLDVVEHLPEPKEVLSGLDADFIVLNLHGYVDTPLHVFNDVEKLWGIMRGMGYTLAEREGYLSMWQSFRKK